jgi:hypothetical protein
MYILHFIWCACLHDSANELIRYSTHPVSVWFRPYTLGLNGCQAVLLLLQQNLKYEVVHVLACLSHMDTDVRPNGKSFHVLGKSTDHFQLAFLTSAPTDVNDIAEMYFHTMFSVVICFACIPCEQLIIEASSGTSTTVLTNLFQLARSRHIPKHFIYTDNDHLNMESCVIFISKFPR